MLRHVHHIADVARKADLARKTPIVRARGSKHVIARSQSQRALDPAVEDAAARHYPRVTRTPPL
jgi:hypothetical protein